MNTKMNLEEKVQQWFVFIQDAVLENEGDRE